MTSAAAHAIHITCAASDASPVDNATLSRLTTDDDGGHVDLTGRQCRWSARVATGDSTLKEARCAH